MSKLLIVKNLSVSCGDTEIRVNQFRLYCRHGKAERTCKGRQIQCILQFLLLRRGAIVQTLWFVCLPVKINMGTALSVHHSTARQVVVIRAGSEQP